MDGVRDRLGDLLEKLQLEGETLSQDELLEYKSILMNDYVSVKDKDKYNNIDRNKVQVLLLLIEKLLKLD